MNSCFHCCRPWTVPRSIRWSSTLRYQSLVRLLRVATFSSSSWILFQGTDDRRSAHCGIPPSTFRIGYPHRAPVSLKVHLSVPVCWCWKLSVILLPLLSWVWVDVSRQFPAAGWSTTLIQFLIHRAIRITRILRRIFLRTQDFPWHQIHWSRFRHCRTFFRSTFRTLLEMTLCFLFEGKWLQENIEEFMIFNKRRRWSHSSRVKLSLVNMSASWFLVDLGVQIDSVVEQPIKSNSSSSWHVSHRWTSALWRSSWSQLRRLQRWTTETRLEKSVRLWWRSPHATTVNISVSLLFGFGFVISRTVFLLRDWLVFWYCSMNVTLQITTSQRSRASSPSIRSPTSSEMISDFVQLGDTDVCFLHIQLMGANVRLPKIHKTPSEIDFVSSRSPAKSESWSKWVRSPEHTDLRIGCS